LAAGPAYHPARRIISPGRGRLKDEAERLQYRRKWGISHCWIGEMDPIELGMDFREKEDQKWLRTRKRRIRRKVSSNRSSPLIRLRLKPERRLTNLNPR
jgi:hypothetical protein